MGIEGPVGSARTRPDVPSPMTASDLLLFLALAVLGWRLVATGRALVGRDRPAERIVEAHATLAGQMAASLVSLAVRLRRAASGADRAAHVEGAFVSATMLMALVLPLVLAAHLARRSGASGDHWALVAGSVTWAVVVATPAALRRMPRGPEVPDIPPLTAIVVVVALDVAVSLLCLSGLLHGAGATAFCVGATAIALPDLVAALLTLTRAAFGP